MGRPVFPKGRPVRYTEDGVLVYTLYLGNVPQQYNREELRKYFSNFGEVTSIVLKKPKWTIFMHGLITFEKPEVAAAALNFKHRSISKRFVIRPAFTWKQPMQRPTKVECDKFVYNASDGATSILDLNDDCLLHIYSYLNSVERLKLAFIDHRFNNITEHFIKVSKELDFNDMRTKFTLMEMRKILSKFGPYIETIHVKGRVDMNYRRYLEFVPNYCQRLIEINFESIFPYKPIFKTYQRLFLPAKNIKSLKLVNCGINNRICCLFVHLTQLKCLHLSCNYITGKHLKKLKNIIDLNLWNCWSLDSKDFIEVCKSMKLKVLNIVECHKLNDASFQNLVETQPDLERIMISNLYVAINVGVIGKLNRLKHIQIHCNRSSIYGTYDNIKNIITGIAEHRKDDLESLEIYQRGAVLDEQLNQRILEFKNLKKLSLIRYDCLDCLEIFDRNALLSKISRNCKQLEEISFAGSTSLHGNGIIEAVKNLIQLRKLDISFCKQLEDNLYHQIVEVLRDRKSTNLLTICAHGTSINRSLVTVESYKGNEDIVALSFETDISFSERYFI